MAHSWLSGVIFYLVFNYLGWQGIVFLLWATGTLTVLILFFYLRSLIPPISRISHISLILTITLTSIILNLRWPARPEIFIYSLTISLLLIDQYRKKYIQVIILIPLVIVIWTNLYGASAIAGLGLVSLLVVKQLFTDRFKIKPEQKYFYLLSAISYPLSLLNPYGFKSLFYSFFFIPKVAVYEAEWAGITSLIANLPMGHLLFFQYQILIYLITLFSLIALLSLNLRVLKKNLLPLLLGLSILAPILTFRHFQMATVLTSPLLAITLTSALSKKFKLTLILATLLLLLNLGIYFWLNPPESLENKNLSASGLIDFIEQNNISGNAFHHINLGGFLTYNLHPGVKVFYDTRDELYLDTQSHKDLLELTGTGKSILPILEKYKISLVIIGLNTDGFSYQDLLYSKDWSVVYFSDSYLLGVPSEIARQKNLTVLNAIDPASATAAKAGMEKEALTQYENILKTDPGSFFNNIYLAQLKIFMGDNTGALKNLESIDFESGLSGFLPKKEAGYLKAQAHLNMAKQTYSADSCINVRESLDKIENDLPVLFFGSQSYTPSTLNKTQAYYYLLCGKDQTLAQRYLSSYLGQQNITPLEKTKTEAEFFSLLK